MGEDNALECSYSRYCAYRPWDYSGCPGFCQNDSGVSVVCLGRCGPDSYWTRGRRRWSLSDQKIRRRQQKEAGRNGELITRQDLNMNKSIWYKSRHLKFIYFFAMADRV